MARNNALKTGARSREGASAHDALVGPVSDVGSVDGMEMSPMLSEPKDRLVTGKKG